MSFIPDLAPIAQHSRRVANTIGSIRSDRMLDRLK
jgi:hypothetical protein